MFGSDQMIDNVWSWNNWNTVSKLQNHSVEITESFYSITQILREIKVGKCRVPKSAISTHLEAVTLDFYEFLHFLKTENDQIDRI